MEEGAIEGGGREGREEERGIEKIKEGKEEEKRIQELEERKEKGTGRRWRREDGRKDDRRERRERKKRMGQMRLRKKKIVKGIAEVEGKWRGIDEMEEGREDGEDKGGSRKGEEA